MSSSHNTNYNTNRFFPTPSLDDGSIRNYSNDEYLEISFELAERCWTHYEGDSHSNHHGTPLYVGSLGPCSYLRLRLAKHLRQKLPQEKSTSGNGIEVRRWSNEGRLASQIDTLLRNGLQSAEEAISRATRKKSDRCTLLEGPMSGALALKAAILTEMGRVDEAKKTANQLVAFLSRAARGLSHSECEVLYGRAGVLQTILFLRSHLSDPDLGRDAALEIIRDIFTEGEAVSGVHNRLHLPLVWEWHNKVYLGAAHGVVGVIFTLLNFTREVNDLSRTMQKDWMGLLRSTVDRLEDCCMPSGNLRSSANSEKDELVHWCHGAPGYILLLIKSSEVFDDVRYLDRAEMIARNVVFSRGLLQKGVGLCHGISGNAYVLLALHRALKCREIEAEQQRRGGYDDEWLKMACHFANFASHKFHDLELVPDRPYSLYEGSAGLAVLILDLVNPEKSRFPCFEY